LRISRAASSLPRFLLRRPNGTRLAVLVDAIRRYGAPEAIVTDGGGQFYSTVALELYEMLGIRKERIDPGEPWQNYAETLFSIQKRLADHAFSNARTWPEMQQAHQTWWQHYNVEHHYAHRERQDGRHSPEAVLRGVL
jgi:putative transposase